MNSLDAYFRIRADTYSGDIVMDISECIVRGVWSGEAKVDADAVLNMIELEMPVSEIVKIFLDSTAIQYQLIENWKHFLACP